ncbi:MAG: hypothetical protein K9M11_00335 [Candidatus Pacebacteria bacterium]|nr:hypothetical protein [Candidatus Paceibacterota bacterium]
MKFSGDIIDKIVKELEKVPNIRYVCSKVGIDHSTFYRWLMRHPSFNKRVLQAQFIGRRAICGTAETVIIKGVQSGDFKASTFYLTHNDPNYMQRDKGEHYSKIMNGEMNVIQSSIKYDGSNFESLFKFLDDMTKSHGEESCTHIGRFMIEFFCDRDQQLIDLFHASYLDWKQEKAYRKEAEERLSLEEK